MVKCLKYILQYNFSNKIIFFYILSFFKIFNFLMLILISYFMYLKVSSRLNIKKKKKASTTNPEKSLDTFLASETEDLLLSIEEGEPYDSSLTNVSERVKSCSNSDPSVTSSVPDMEKVITTLQ